MHTFSRWEVFSAREFSREEFTMGRELSGKILHWWNLPELFHEILLMSYFLFSHSILLVEWLRVIICGRFSLGLNYLEDISGRGGISHGGGTRFPGII